SHTQSCSSIILLALLSSFFLFFFKAPATPGIYTLSLHDALPISEGGRPRRPDDPMVLAAEVHEAGQVGRPVGSDVWSVLRRPEGVISEEHLLAFPIVCSEDIIGTTTLEDVPSSRVLGKSDHSRHCRLA